MNIIFLLIAASAVVALIFLGLFIVSVRRGQYDDTWSPARRMLIDDDPVTKTTNGGRTGTSVPTIRMDR
jgi:cbb3-type cytochrome oxidase maturation protein